MLRRDLYAPRAECVARVYTRLRAAVEGREPLDGRTVALSVVLGYPKFRGPLKHARDVVLEQIDPRAGELHSAGRQEKDERARPASTRPSSYSPTAKATPSRWANEPPTVLSSGLR